VVLSLSFNQNRIGLGHIMTDFQEDIDELNELITTNKKAIKEFKAHKVFFEALQLYEAPKDAIAAPHAEGGVGFWLEDEELTILSVMKGEPEHYLGMNKEDVELLRDLCNIILNQNK